MGLSKTIVVKSTGSAMADMKRETCLNAVNALSDKEISNLLKLVKSEKIKGYLNNDIKIKLLIGL